MEFTDRMTERGCFPPLSMDVGQGIEGEFAIRPGRRQWPGRMVVSGAKIFEHEDIFYRSEAAHHWWRFNARRKLPVELYLAVCINGCERRFDQHALRQVGRCFSGIRYRQKNE